MEPTKQRYDLEERLINLAVSIIALVESMPGTKSATHMAGQLLRSGTSPALNYGEAQGGESRKDFAHKIKIVLKELRETLVSLKIISRAKLYDKEAPLTALLKEVDELIAIFATSVKTLKGE